MHYTIIQYVVLYIRCIVSRVNFLTINLLKKRRKKMLINYREEIYLLCLIQHYLRVTNLASYVIQSDQYSVE